MRSLTMTLALRRASAFLAYAALGVMLSVRAINATEIQNFNTEASSNALWSGSNNNPIAGTGGAGGTIYFSNTNNTLGNPGGEGGGPISRTDGVPAYYADLTLGGTYNVHSDLLVTGELYYQNTNADVSVAVGYFDNTLGANMVAADNLIGFVLSGGNIRVWVFGGDWGGYDGSGGNAGAATNSTLATGAYTWTLSYNGDAFTPSGGQFNFGEVTLTVSPLSVGATPTFTLRNALNPLQNRLSRVLNSFGLAVHNSSDTDSFATDTVFVDSLTYSSFNAAVPEPSSLTLAALGIIGFLAVGRRRPCPISM